MCLLIVSLLSCIFQCVYILILSLLCICPMFLLVVSLFSCSCPMFLLVVSLFSCIFQYFYWLSHCYPAFSNVCPGCLVVFLQFPMLVLLISMFTLILPVIFLIFLNAVMVDFDALINFVNVYIIDFRKGRGEYIKIKEHFYSQNPVGAQRKSTVL